MKPIFKILTTVMAVIGSLLVYGGISTSDYYIIELGQAEPTYVWRAVAIGVLLILPAVIRAIVSNGRNANEIE